MDGLDEGLRRNVRIRLTRQHVHLMIGSTHQGHENGCNGVIWVNNLCNKNKQASFHKTRKTGWTNLYL